MGTGFGMTLSAKDLKNFPAIPRSKMNLKQRTKYEHLWYFTENASHLLASTAFSSQKFMGDTRTPKE